MSAYCEEQLIIELQKYLTQYDRVYLLAKEYIQALKMSIPDFVNAVTQYNMHNDILWLSVICLPFCLNGKNVCKQIEDEELMAFQRLYYMYEFSDRVQLLSKKSNCGELIHYIYADLFTPEEVVKIILK